MTDAQATAQYDLLYSMYSNNMDSTLVAHQSLGVSMFLAHVLAGVLFLVLMFGIVLASALRRKG